MKVSRLFRTFSVIAGFAAFASLVATQSAAPTAAPATPPPPPDAIEGVWVGTVSAPQGDEAEIGFEFSRSPRGTLIFGKLHFPAMFTYDFPFGIPVEIGGEGNYKVTPDFNIVLHLDGDALTGTFGIGQLPLELARGGTFSAKPATPTHPPAPAPLWSFAMDAGTWAPPVAEAGVIYIGTSAGKFHAVSATTGSAVWSWTGAHGIAGRAVIAGHTVYFVDVKNHLVALDRASGSQRWLTALHDEQIAGKPVPDNPTFNHRAAIPLVIDDIVYVGSSDGGLYAINVATGAKLWRHDAKAPIFSGIGRHGADILMFGTMDGSVVLLDRRTRKEKLRAKTGGGVVTTPLIAGGRLIVGSRDYMLYGFNVDDGSVAWRYSYWFSWVESTPVERDGTIYVGASDYSRIVALDPATGKRRWMTPVHGMNWGSPLVTEERVFTGFASQNLPMTVINHEGGIAALDRQTGAILWRLVSPKAPEGQFGGYAGSLTLADDKVIAAGFDGALVAFPAK